MSKEINILALAKGEERYLFLFSDSQRAEALRMLGRHASNPELSFSWYDAAVLGQQIRSTSASPTPKPTASCPLPINAGQPRFQLPPVSDLFTGGLPE